MLNNQLDLASRGPNSSYKSMTFFLKKDIECFEFRFRGLEVVLFSSLLDRPEVELSAETGVGKIRERDSCFQ